jgi:hypothetical protein
VVIWIGTNDVLQGGSAAPVAARIMEAARQKAYLKKSFTTESTEDTEVEVGQRLAGQAGAAFSNPSASELARDSENTALTRCASGHASSLGTSYSLPVTAPEAPTPATSYSLPVTAPKAPTPATSYPLPVTRYPLPVTRYPLPVTRYPLPVTRYPLLRRRRKSSSWGFRRWRLGGRGRGNGMPRFDLYAFDWKNPGRGFPDS